MKNHNIEISLIYPYENDCSDNCSNYKFWSDRLILELSIILKNDNLKFEIKNYNITMTSGLHNIKYERIDINSEFSYVGRTDSYKTEEDMLKEINSKIIDNTIQIFHIYPIIKYSKITLHYKLDILIDDETTSLENDIEISVKR